MKKLIAMLLCLSMLFALPACGNQAGKNSADPSGDPTGAPSQATGEKGKIGGGYASLSFDFQLQMSNGIERAAKEHGYEYMSYDYNFDSENMLSGLDTVKASGVKALYGLFVAPESATDFMKSNSDIGVLTQGEVVDGALAGTINDYVTLGQQFVEALDQFVTENNITSGEIGALWLENCENQDSDYYTAKEDIKGVINQWCEDKDFTFTVEFYPPDDESAANYTAQILNANPNLKALFCFNNGYATAAANEISASVPDASDYFVFSSEGDAESFRLIQSGTSPYRACAYMDIEASGYQVGLQLINWIENGTMENVIVEKVLVDSTNVADYIE